MLLLTAFVQTPDGIVQHYATHADASDKPNIVQAFAKLLAPKGSVLSVIAFKMADALITGDNLAPRPIKFSAYRQMAEVAAKSGLLFGAKGSKVAFLTVQED